MNLLTKLNSLLAHLPGVQWINKNLSNSPTTSNSRTIQSIVVVSLVIMLWLALAHTGWVITESWASVAKTLIITAGGAYAAGKAGDAFNSKGDSQ